MTFMIIRWTRLLICVALPHSFRQYIIFMHVSTTQGEVIL
jgi:hypothetical protein